MTRLLLLLLCLPLGLLTACKDITHVQTGYVADRDDCRGSSEGNVNVYSNPGTSPMSDKDRNGALLQLFCECMKQKDWRVAGCPKPATPPATAVAAAPAQTVVVVQQPTAQPTAAYTPPPPPPEQQPTAVYQPTPVKKHKKPKVCTPPGTCAAPTGYAAPYSARSTPIPPSQESQQLNGILGQQ